MRTITIHTGEYDVTQPPATDRLCGVLWLVRIQRRGGPRRLDRAEPAAARARIAHQLQHIRMNRRQQDWASHHDCSSCRAASLRLGGAGLTAPAIANIWASCFL